MLCFKEMFLVQALQYKFVATSKLSFKKVTLHTLNVMHSLTMELLQSFTKPPLLQESRLTGGGSPNLVDLNS